MKIRRRWIYLPIEVKDRELIPKIFFAGTAIAQGYGIFLGRNGMNISRKPFPPGIYFDKCLSTHKLEFHRRQVEALGNRLVSLDDEGLVIDKERFLSSRIGAEAIELSSVVFCWGDSQRDAILERYPSNKVLSVGSPRLDCWRKELGYIYQPEADRLRSRYGNFILIPSNFGLYTFDPSSDSSFESLSPHEKSFWQDKDWARGAFLEIIPLIGKAFPNHNLIVRPHPGENKKWWEFQREVLKGNGPSNVHIIADGSVTPWIKAAGVVVHHACTTAVEAWVGMRKVISYMPGQLSENIGPEKWGDLPNSLGKKCLTQESLLKTLDYLLSDEMEHARDTEELACASRYMAIDPEKSCSAKIVESLSKLDVQEESFSLRNFSRSDRLRSSIERTIWGLTDLWNRNPVTLSYHLQKNPGISDEELHEWLDRFTPEWENARQAVKVSQVGRDTFCLYA